MKNEEVSQGTKKNDNIFKDNVYYSPKEIQETLKIGKTTLYKLIKARAFPILQIGRSTRVRGKDLQIFLETHTNHRYNLK